MSKIYRLAGTNKGPLVTTPYQIYPGMDAAELSLLLMRERLELEQQIAQRAAGIGTTLDNSYEYNLQLLNAAIKNYHTNPQSIAGIGSAIGATRFGNWLREQGTKVTNTAKDVVAVVHDVVALPMKAVMEVAIPNAGPGFLYLFLKPEQLDKLPDKVRTKRKKQENLAKFLVNVSSMKEDHFLSLCRNGIMKQTGKTPEQILDLMMKNAGTTAQTTIQPATTSPTIIPSRSTTGGSFLTRGATALQNVIQQETGPGTKGILRNGYTFELSSEKIGNDYRAYVNGQPQGGVVTVKIVNGIASGTSALGHKYWNDGTGWKDGAGPISGVGFAAALVPIATQMLSSGATSSSSGATEKKQSGPVFNPASVLKALGDLIEKIVSIFKKNPPDKLTENDVASYDDFLAAGYSPEQAAQLFQQGASIVNVPSGDTVIKMAAYGEGANKQYLTPTGTSTNTNTNTTEKKEPNWLLIAGIGAGVYLLTQKK